jgi:hypothetical protein
MANVSLGMRRRGAAAPSSTADDSQARVGRTPGVSYNNEYEICEGCDRKLFYWNFTDLSDPFPGDQMYFQQGEGREIVLCEDCQLGWQHNHKKLSLENGQLQLDDPLDE